MKLPSQRPSMVVPMWIEFIVARNGTSDAGSSSPVLEKCSNSSAKRMKRCRSDISCGSISVVSDFLMTDIENDFSRMAFLIFFKEYLAIAEPK